MQKHINNNGKNKSARKEAHMQELEQDMSVNDSKMKTGLKFAPPTEQQRLRREVCDNLGNPKSILLPFYVYDIMVDAFKDSRISRGSQMLGVLFGKGCIYMKKGELYFKNDITSTEHKINREE